MPLGHESGDDRFLAPLQAGVPYESGPERQRQLYRQTGNWKAVIDDLSHRLSQELDKAVPASTPASNAPTPAPHAAPTK